MKKYSPPKFKGKAFNCPHCEAYSHMRWEQLVANRYLIPVWQATCSCCEESSYWLQTTEGENEEMISPRLSTAPLPNPDMPEVIQNDFNEARFVVDVSPRAAAALLRLAIQKLCIELGGDGKNINEDIKSLVNNGLPTKIQSALDSVRVIGNEAVHLGELQPDDIEEVAYSLFNLVNLIVEYQITQPKEVNAVFQALPEKKRKAIKDRDKSKND
ncbi:MAG TPA: DUF4145 domain-containing protein [Sphaerochaeta sp.]|jgi:hypothetical protein|nr:DUF4145 domain-containing protein [Spirochaetales bacterium]OQA42308.1 MAG: hypothetical protein BWY50_01535 [Spirochaetes bacterium ADurb.Bin315]HPX28686.1 DUF4145 domain-containing protein [Sphaerochaeta sp.]HQB54352.1 DUF4145 domain-containing protein [Sphaerochaeta sp.]